MCYVYTMCTQCVYNVYTLYTHDILFHKIFYIGRSGANCRITDTVIYSKLIAGNKAAGWLVPQDLRDDWVIHWGDSKKELEKLEGEYDFFLHDSLHTAEHVKAELNAVWGKLAPGAIVLADDIDWHDGFHDFCHEKDLPLKRLSRSVGLTFKPEYW